MTNGSGEVDLITPLTTHAWEAIITFSTQFSVGVNITLSPAQNGLKSTEIEAEGVHGGYAPTHCNFGIPVWCVFAISHHFSSQQQHSHLPHTNLLQRKQ